LLSTDGENKEQSIVRLGHCAITWGGIVAEAAGVGSIANLYYRSLDDIRLAAREIAEEGFQGIEVFDGNLVVLRDEAVEVRRTWDRIGLELVSVYVGANFIFGDVLEEELGKVRQSALLAREFGASHLVFGGGARRAAGVRDDDVTALARGLDRAAGIASDLGLTSSYHPHLGTIVESPEELARLMPLTSVQFCPDTGHLAAGGGNPAEEIRKYGDRLAHVHLKDFDFTTGAFVALGEGDLDFAEIITALREENYDGWLMVELDEYGGDPREAAAISMAHLRGLIQSPEWR
jgi:inosose dehydratase